MYWVYVLLSNSKKIYIGQTNDLQKRIKQHNDRNFDKKSYTKLSGSDWKIVYKEEYGNRNTAIQKEKYLKSHIGRDWLRSKISGR